MYRVSKVLNNNGIIAINMEETRNMYFWEKVWDLERRSASVLSSGRLYYLQAGSGDRTWLSKRTGKEHSTGISGDRR